MMLIRDYTRSDEEIVRRQNTKMTGLGSEMCFELFCSRVLVHLGLAALLLVLRTRSVGGNSALKLGGLSDTLTLLRLLGVLGDLRAVVGIVIGHALLLAGHLVEALGLLAGRGLSC